MKALPYEAYVKKTALEISLASALEAYGATDAQEFSDNTISVTFCLLGNPSGFGWRKAVRLNKDGVTLRGVLHLMNEWKREKLVELDFANPSDTIKYVAQTYGLEAVKEALEPWPIH